MERLVGPIAGTGRCRAVLLLASGRCRTRVIKVERADGDFARFYDRSVGQRSTYFVWFNRGKQSLVADIKSSQDATLLHAILEKADVFIQNLAPGASARAGFDSARLRARDPQRRLRGHESQ